MTDTFDEDSMAQEFLYLKNELDEARMHLASYEVRLENLYAMRATLLCIASTTTCDHARALAESILEIDNENDG